MKNYLHNYSALEALIMQSLHAAVPDPLADFERGTMLNAMSQAQLHIKQQIVNSGNEIVSAEMIIQ